MSYEQPDTLRSKSHARLLDLVSEGPIEGLVDGLRGVYLDDTPLMNPNGTLNFQGVVFQERKGDGNQTPIPGFPYVESTTAENVEIKYGVPVVRHFTDANLDAVRITIGIPTLLSQNTDNGDTYGANVAFSVDVQNNGGGFVPQVLSYAPHAMNWTGSVLQSDVASTTYEVTTTWTRGGISGPRPALSCQYTLQYRPVGSSTWTTYGTRTISVTAAIINKNGKDSVSLTLPNDRYEFRSVFSGTSDGSLSLAGSVYSLSYMLVIAGKTTSRYQRDIRVPLTGSGPWDVRIRRLTPDSTTQYIQNKSYLDATTEIIDAKLQYPFSAYYGISVDASQFTNIPRRAYKVRGLKIQVPTNYDPLNRTYTGAWDGSFKTAWSNNPAWCFYDLLTNPRYGLGAFIPAAQVDKWSLYAIGKYCDELVDDGFGGKEPRFTCNLYLQTRADAYKVINDMASIFRGLVYWASASITAVQDAPGDAAYLYTPANVIDGMFNYVGSSAKARHTVALVSWNDPDDMYRQKVEYVEDTAGIAKYGIVTTEVAAFGCTSRGQAHRVGRWLLYTERLQSEVVTFKTGMDGNLCRPGQVIKIADPARAGVRFGGRLVSGSAVSVTLDAPVTLNAGETYTLSTLKSDGTVQDATVTTGPGTTSTLSLSPGFAEMPAVGGIWILTSTTVNPQFFRVISVNEQDAEQFEISALAHDPNKFDMVEQGLMLQPRSISNISVKPEPPTNGSISEYLYEAATDLKTMAVFSWTGSDGAQTYRVRYRRDNGNMVDLPATSTTSVLVQDAQPGSYEVSVYAVNAIGYESAPLVFTGSVLGKVAPPKDVTGLQLSVQGTTGTLSWDAHPDLDVKLGGKIVVRHTTNTTNPSWSTAVPLPSFSGASTSGPVPLLSGTYLVKAEDTSGSQSVNAALVTTQVPSILQYNVVVVDDQAPTFAGTKTNMEVSGGNLILGASVLFDSIPDVDAMTGSFDGGTVASGAYDFDAPLDLGAVYNCRVTADIGVYTYDTSNIVDGWASVDAVANIDGALASDTAEVKLYISTTLDDPNGAPTWTEPRLFTVGDYQARGYRFSLAVSRGSSESQQVAVTRCAITVDVPDRVEGDNAVTVPVGGMRVSFSAPFFATPAIAVTAESLATGDYFTLTGKDAMGFYIQFYNSSGTSISRTMDWIAKGYGYKTT